MAQQYLDFIYNLPDNYYKGYRSATYLKEKFVPYFTEINKKKLILTKEELRKLESHICTGKSRSLLSDSLYNCIDILSLITENNLLTEKFVIRIIDIIKLHLDKNQHLNKKINFSWVLNLKKNSFKFNDQILNLLETIGFKNGIKMDQEIDNVELEFIHLLTYKKDSKVIISYTINTFLDKYPDFVPKYEHLKCFVENLSMNYVNNLTYFEYEHIQDFITIYDRFKKNKYHASENDLMLFLDVLNSYFKGMYSSYKAANTFMFDHVFNLMKKFISKLQENNIYLNENMINKYLKNNLLKINFQYYYKEGMYKYALFLKTVQELLINYLDQNKNNKITNLNILDKISIIQTRESSEEFSNTYYKLIKFLNEKSLLNINDDTILQLISNWDNIALNYIIDNNLISLNESMMNYACYALNIELIKKMINNKFVANIKNIYYLRLNATHTASRTQSLEILNLLISLGGLLVDDELIEYLIKKDCCIKDLEKYGLDTQEMKNKILNMCIKYNKYPYKDIITCDFSEKIKNISNITTINEIEELLNNLNFNEKIGLLNLLIRYDNAFGVIYMVKKYPDICKEINIKNICNPENLDIYLDIFKDLKIN